MAKKKKNNLTELSFDEIFIILEMINQCDKNDPFECMETIDNIKKNFGGNEYGN